MPLAPAARATSIALSLAVVATLGLAPAASAQSSQSVSLSTAASSTYSSTATKKVTLKVARGQKVSIQRKSGNKWVTVASAKAKNTGKKSTLSITAKLSSGKHTYRAYSASTSRVKSAASKSFTVTKKSPRSITATVSIPKSTTKSTESLAYTVSIATGQKVSIQRKSGSKWVTVASAKAKNTGKKSSGKVSAPVTLGTHSYRMVVAGSSSTKPLTTRSSTIKRTAAPAVAITASVSGIPSSATSPSASLTFKLSRSAGQKITVERREGTVWKLAGSATAANTSRSSSTKVSVALAVGTHTYRFKVAASSTTKAVTLADKKITRVALGSQSVTITAPSTSSSNIVPVLVKLKVNSAQGVRLERFTGSSWSLLGVFTAPASGSSAFTAMVTLPVGKHSVRARVNETTSVMGAMSDNIYITHTAPPPPAVRINQVDYDVPVGSTSLVEATVSSPRGQDVLLEEKVGQEWVVLGKKTASVSALAFSVPVSQTERVATMRVRSATLGSVKEALSPTFYVVYSSAATGGQNTAVSLSTARPLMGNSWEPMEIAVRSSPRTGQTLSVQVKESDMWRTVSTITMSSALDSYVNIPSFEGERTMRLVAHAKSGNTTSVSSNFTVYQSPSAYKSMVTQAQSYISTWCPYTPISVGHPDLAKYGAAGLAYHSYWYTDKEATLLYQHIAISPGMSGKSLEWVMLHECAHVIQSRQIALGLAKYREITDVTVESIFAPVAGEPSARGVERQADCIALEMGPQFTLGAGGYTKNCAGARKASAQQVLKDFGLTYQRTPFTTPL